MARSPPPSSSPKRIANAVCNRSVVEVTLVESTSMRL